MAWRRRRTRKQINFSVNLDKLSEKHGLVLTKEIFNRTEIDLVIQIDEHRKKINVYRNNQWQESKNQGLL